MDAKYIKAAIVGVSAIVGLSSVYIFKMKPDNVIEEKCEDVIEKQTGLNIDLTPGSPENKTTDTN